MIYGFASDNAAGAHPDVLAALTRANTGYALGYGGDPWSRRAGERLAAAFGPAAVPFFVLTGTAANVLALHAMTRPYEAVICAAGSHVDIDECGALEAMTGRKLLTVPTADGKLRPELIEPLLQRPGLVHAAQPRVISVSQATELGTCYTREELTELCSWAAGRGLLVHLDGARLANAAAHLGASLAELTVQAGVAAVSFGGAKNGMAFGEAVLLLRPELADGFDYLRKQSMQLISKLRYVAAQFGALLTDDLWLRNAVQANTMAGRLADRLGALPGVRVTQRVQANAVFAELSAAAVARLQRRYAFPVWNAGRHEVRWMCSWSTTPAEVDALVAEIARATDGG